LAGGHWSIMEQVIKTHVPNHINVNVYDFQ